MCPSEHFADRYLRKSIAKSGTCGKYPSPSSTMNLRKRRRRAHGHPWDCTIQKVVSEKVYGGERRGIHVHDHKTGAGTRRRQRKAEGGACRVRRPRDAGGATTVTWQRQR